ncbi:hypothetical protein MBT84_42415 [Streptomyces sp. MBT84]|uniref:PAS domain-containing protein n=1 Tax=Streptomyces sp. MBT84 TaxID=1488414 RepID=UPI001C6EA4E8|nr:PAS domain-containing protein [Streptomyces sp. MBT84]MBW8706293.1 hypothetical protein [Streptomyces sp. MBT84]
MGSADEAAADRDPLASGEGAESDGAVTAVIDADGTVAGWTQAAHTLLGYTAREVLGRPLADLLAAADPGPFVAAVLRGAAAPGGWSGTVRLRHRAVITWMCSCGSPGSPRGTARPDGWPRPATAVPPPTGGS